MQIHYTRQEAARPLDSLWCEGSALARTGPGALPPLERSSCQVLRGRTPRPGGRRAEPSDQGLAGFVRSVSDKARLVLFALFAATAALAEPKIINGSFEADRYSKYPGLAKQHSGITGWKCQGNVGVNPWWQDAAKRTGPVHSYTDNGRVPHGRQMALMQNKCKLWQTVQSFEKGRKYVVTYHENARYLNWSADGPPRIKVTLGGELIVSEHAVKPVGSKNERILPFAAVESAVFTAPRSGTFDLVFETTVSNRVTVLLDRVAVREAR